MFFNFLSKKENKTKKVALVLSGGGARGFFHIGVIKALKELNIEITEIAGTSMGALIGLIYANNPDIDFDELISCFYSKKMVSFFDSNYFEQIVKNLEKFLKKYVKATTFNKLSIPFSFNATDLKTYNLINFSSGKIFPAIMGSISMPGLMKPLNYKNMVLCDGGTICPIPLNSIKKSKKILISDVSIVLNKDNNFNNPINLFDSLVGIPERYNFIRDLKEAKKRGIKYFSINYDRNIHTFDFRRKSIESVIKCGYEYTIKNKKNILRLINR